MARLARGKSIESDPIDLFDRTRDAGFQEEKYEAYILTVRWARGDLKALIEKRINEVFRRQYTKENIEFLSFFPSPRKGGGVKADDYILDRTLLRPRDTLQYANECFFIAADRERISWRSMYAAEATYSSKRLKSLKEEWSEFYPCLEDSVEILRGLNSPFTRSALSGDRFEKICMTLHDGNEKDPCSNIIQKYFSTRSSNVSEADIISTILQSLYHAGIIGIKISTLDTFIWSYVDQPRISKSEVKRANQIKIHKMLHHALEIRDETKI